MKWMNRPSVIEMDRAGVHEMDGQKQCKKMEMPLKWIKFNNAFYNLFKKSYEMLFITVAFQFFVHFVGLSIS